MRITTLLSTAAMLAATAASAAAADLPMEAPPAVVSVDGFSWSGVYIGGAIGYAWSDLKVRNSRLGDNFRYRNNVDSLIGSGFVGVNYQFEQVVVGAEADLSYADFGGKNRGCFRGFVCKANAGDWFGTIRGRVGFAMDRALFFGTAGLAIAEGVDFKRTGAPFSFDKDKSGTRYGYALGAGVDYAVTDNVILRGEYQYVDFGRESVRAVNAIGGGQPAKIDQVAHIVRAGVAYKF
ncbi:MAG: hypothetical protein DI565_05695 [Ancylobacter novellus]|uniref:Outer membrane protein beta-barrel domain-containing protein n=1 Tax=Ancylobacter novellus TaxID=921 RepID=A0A2W5KIG1_ANCNO|nr:MAG: hypothetical protein DI565_05695 [Ancylobacter novellus]